MNELQNKSPNGNCTRNGLAKSAFDRLHFKCNSGCREFYNVQVQNYINQEKRRIHEKNHTNGKWVALNALKYKIFHKLVQLQKSSGAKTYGKEHIEVINWSVFVIRLKFIVMCTWVHSTNENLVNIANQPVLTYFSLRIYFPCGTFAFQKNNQILNHF